jgi:hypothetical protein
VRATRFCTNFIFFAVVFSLISLFPFSLTAQQQDTRTQVQLDIDGTFGLVLFDHVRHQAYINTDPQNPHKATGSACIGCHHTVKNDTDRYQFQKCTTCHKMEGDPSNPADAEGYDLSAREIYHRNCIGCHRALNVKASNVRFQNVSFTKCKECHLAGEIGVPIPPEPELKVVKKKYLPPPVASHQPFSPPKFDPLGFAGASRVKKYEQEGPDFMPLPDRWRIGFPEDPRYKKGRALNPYGQNVLKGDYPLFGQKTFVILLLESDNVNNGRRLPVPSDVSSQEPDSSEFFGRGEQYFLRQNFVASAELFHGDAAFKPVDWRIRVTPNININYLYTRENGIVNIDPRRGNTRVDSHVGLQEAFGELRLFSTDPYFDTTSVRVGIQPFISDFRGFLFYDFNLSARLFGNFKSNRFQYNATYFDMLEKDTNSDLNKLEFRDQRIVIANFFFQDFGTKGYTTQFSYHFNQDKPGLHTGELFHYDENEFLVRPANIGDVAPHEIKVHYAGWTSDGHIGRLNITHAVYEAIGEDDRNPIAGRKIDINAQMAALELSIDKDWMRYKASIFWSSGDSDPLDDEGKGFDAIFDAPEFAGGKFSFWNSQSIRLTQTGVALVNPDSLLPSLRSSKTEGQANFVNPGLFLYNVGFDADLTPKLKGIFNVNYLRFHHTEPLELLLFQNGIGKEIGLDAGVGFLYRPLLNENAIVAVGFSTLIPGNGLKDIFSSNCSGQFCGADSKVLFSGFVRVKFTY